MPSIKDGKVIKGEIMVGILCSTKMLRVPGGATKRLKKKKRKQQECIICVPICVLQECIIFWQKFGGWNERPKD